MSDPELLRRYLRERSDAAFATLVERHLPLVYSAARRQVRSPAHAADVAQSVFVALARQAAALPPDQSLVAWLHVVTRRTAIDLVRAEARRTAREHAAAVGLVFDLPSSTAMTPPSLWTELSPLLDEAVESLPEPDRTAVLLRFFENKSHRDIGAALGTSADAAQKRVSRALDQLRTFFLRRGVTVTAAGLATDLSAHALQTAPLTLGAAITSGALAAGTATFHAATSTAAQTIVMTTLQKTLAVTTLAAIGGFGLYQVTLFAHQSDELRTLRERGERVSSDLRTLRATRDQTTGRLQAVETEIDTRLAAFRSTAPTDPALETQMREWLARVKKVRRRFADHPDQAIPELASLKDSAWFTLGNEPIDSEESLRRAASRARHLAEDGFGANLSQALRSYAKSHGNMLPSTPQELAPFCDPPIERAILDRYEMLRTGSVANLSASDRTKVLSIKSPIDPEFDSIPQIGPNAYGSTTALGVATQDALRRFASENSGRRPTTAAQLRPYLKWPLRDEVLQHVLDRQPASSR